MSFDETTEIGRIHSELRRSLLNPKGPDPARAAIASQGLEKILPLSGSKPRTMKSAEPVHQNPRIGIESKLGPTNYATAKKGVADRFKKLTSGTNGSMYKSAISQELTKQLGGTKPNTALQFNHPKSNQALQELDRHVTHYENHQKGVDAEASNRLKSLPSLESLLGKQPDPAEQDSSRKSIKTIGGQPVNIESSDRPKGAYGPTGRPAKNKDVQQHTNRINAPPVQNAPAVAAPEGQAPPPSVQASRGTPSKGINSTDLNTHPTSHATAALDEENVTSHITKITQNNPVGFSKPAAINAQAQPSQSGGGGLGSTKGPTTESISQVEAPEAPVKTSTSAPPEEEEKPKSSGGGGLGSTLGNILGDVGAVAEGAEGDEEPLENKLSSGLSRAGDAANQVDPGADDKTGAGLQKASGIAGGIAAATSWIPGVGELAEGITGLLGVGSSLYDIFHKPEANSVTRPDPVEHTETNALDFTTAGDTSGAIGVQA